MDFQKINNLFSNKNIEIKKSANIDFTELVTGKFYAYFTENINFREEAKYLNIFYVDYSIFKRIKVGKLLKKYGFTDQEILLLLEEFNLRYNDYADRIYHISIKASLLIDILFKKNDIILFSTSGLSYQSSEKIYRRIYEKLRAYPDKTAIIFENIPFYHKTDFEIVSEYNIQNYEEWRISHYVVSPYYIEIRDIEDINYFGIKKGVIYSCFTQTSNLAEKLSLANYPHITGTTGFYYNNINIFKRLIRNPFWKIYYKKEDIDKRFKKISLFIDTSFKYWNQIILFDMKYWPVALYPEIMNYIYNKHLEFPQKTIIVFEKVKDYGKTSFEIMNKPIIDDYMNWRLNHIRTNIQRLNQNL